MFSIGSPDLYAGTWFGIGAGFDWPYNSATIKRGTAINMGTHFLMVFFSECRSISALA